MTVLTLDEVKSHLNISDTGSDGELMSFAARAEAAVATRCGPLQPTTVTDRVRGYGSSLCPRVTPISTITSVTPVGGSALDVSRLVAPSVGPRGPRCIEYVNGGVFGSRWYDVTYEAGWADVPEDLRLAVLEAVRYYWQTQLGNSPAVNGALPSSGDVDYPSTSDVPLGAFPWVRIQHLIEQYEQVWL